MHKYYTNIEMDRIKNNEYRKSTCNKFDFYIGYYPGQQIQTLADNKELLKPLGDTIFNMLTALGVAYTKKARKELTKYCSSYVDINKLNEAVPKLRKANPSIQTLEFFLLNQINYTIGVAFSQNNNITYKELTDILYAEYVEKHAILDCMLASVGLLDNTDSKYKGELRQIENFYYHIISVAIVLLLYVKQPSGIIADHYDASLYNTMYNSVIQEDMPTHLKDFLFNILELERVKEVSSLPTVMPQPVDEEDEYDF